MTFFEAVPCSAIFLPLHVHMHFLTDREIIVKSRIGIVVAAALLSVGALEAVAGEPQFQAPSTERARETQPLLTRTAEIGRAHV